MQIENQMFGTVEIEEDKIFHFADGIVGFEDQKRFILIDLEELRPLAWLVSVDEPEIAFPLADARFFVKDYEVGITGDDRDALDVSKGDDVAIYAIVSLPTDERAMTANLRGPVIINLTNRFGRQIVLRDERYSARADALADATSVSAT